MSNSGTKTALQRTSPILIVRFSLLFVVSTVVLTINMTIYDDMTSLFLKMQSVVEAPPCAIATPSAKALLNGLGCDGYSWSPLGRYPTEMETISRIRRSVCQSTTVYQAMVSVLVNASLRYTKDFGSDPPTFARAERDLNQRLCQNDPEKDIYYAIRRRIATAYVLANPAFRRYHSSGCMGINDPLDSCTYGDILAKVEMEAASENVLLSESDNLPPVGHMIYRLLTLALIADADRLYNSNRCFANVWSENATALCQRIYNGTTYPISNAETIQEDAIPGYKQAIDTQASCDNMFSGHSAQHMDPPPPPPPEWAFEHIDLPWLGSIDPVIDSCRNIHSIGHFDQQSAFGIPDIAAPFSWKPAHVDGPGGWFYDALVKNKIEKMPTTSTIPINRLKLYVAYRIAVASAMMTLTGAVSGYWLGYGLMPLLIIALDFVREYRAGRPPFESSFYLVDQYLGTITAMVIFVSIVVWMYSSIFDPWNPVARAYVVDTDCSKWYSNGFGNVFVTSDFVTGSNDYLSNYFLLILPFIPITGWVFKKFQDRQDRLKGADTTSKGGEFGEPRFAWVFTLLPVIGIALNIDVIVYRGNQWFQMIALESPKKHEFHKDVAESLIEDTDSLIVYAITSGIACSITMQRWAVENFDRSPNNIAKRFWAGSIVLCLCIPFMHSKIAVFFKGDNDGLAAPAVIVLCSLTALVITIFHYGVLERNSTNTRFSDIIRRLWKAGGSKGKGADSEIGYAKVDTRPGGTFPAILNDVKDLTAKASSGALTAKEGSCALQSKRTGYNNPVMKSSAPVITIAVPPSKRTRNASRITDITDDRKT